MPSETQIRPIRGLGGIGIRELWERRELLYFLTWRDLKVRYKQTFFGAAWALLQPLLLMMVFSVFLGRLGQIPSEGYPYPLFVLTGLVPWTFFAQSLTGAAESVVNSSHIVSKVYFPRLILPLSAASSFLIDFCIAIGVVLAMVAYYDLPFSLRLLWLAPLALFTLLAALSIGIFLAAVNVRYRDVRHAVPFFVQVGLFLSPVAYPAGLVPDEWKLLYGLNPMVGAIEGFRWTLLGGSGTPGTILAVSAVATLAVLIFSIWYFHNAERAFADVI